VDAYVTKPDRTKNQDQAPRARVILEFLDGDLSRVPVVYPTAGSAEADEALRREILKRWNRG
jgi:hypothetical protein